METLPAKLCLLRQVVGLSQYQLAFFLNVSQPTYCRWEVAKAKPRWRNLETIAKFYQLSVSELIAIGSNELALQILSTKLSKSEGSKLKTYLEPHKKSPTITDRAFSIVCRYVKYLQAFPAA